MGFSIRQKPLSAAYDLHQRATDYQEFNTGVLHLLHEGRLIWCQARPHASALFLLWRFYAACFCTRGNFDASML
jgi:hypothetical protein